MPDIEELRRLLCERINCDYERMQEINRELAKAVPALLAERDEMLRLGRTTEREARILLAAEKVYDQIAEFGKTVDGEVIDWFWREVQAAKRARIHPLLDKHAAKESRP
jgi:hypothetical protein